MSDIQNQQYQTPASLIQASATRKLVQQRQILAMMGIGQWVQFDSVTLDIADIAANAQPLVSAPVSTEDTLDSNLQLSPQSMVQTDHNPPAKEQDFIRDDKRKADSESATTYHFDSIKPKESSVAPAIAPLLEQTRTLSAHSDSDDAGEFTSQDKVAPFDLQGARYGNWVLIVDIQALDSDSQKLWQNIVKALTLDCETTSFPICAGMDSRELANASLAGYIFRIGRSEEIQVAALTELPKGLTHPNVVAVPTLASMLADSTLKRELWQQISSS